MPNPLIEDYVSWDVVLPHQTITAGDTEGTAAWWEAYTGMAFVIAWGNGGASVGATAPLTIGFLGASDRFGPYTAIPTTDFEGGRFVIDDPDQALPMAMVYKGDLPYVKPLFSVATDAHANVGVLATYFNPSRGAPRPVGFGI